MKLTRSVLLVAVVIVVSALAAAAHLTEQFAAYGPAFQLLR